MGVSFSSNELKSDISQLNQAIFTATTNVKNQLGQNCSTNQLINFTLGPKAVTQSPITLNQNAQTVCNFTGQAVNTLTNDVKTNLSSTLNQIYDQSNKTIQGFLTANLGSSSNNVDTKTYIENTISNNINTFVTNNCNQYLNTAQAVNVTLDGFIASNAPFTINQDAQSTGFANCIVTNLLNTNIWSQGFIQQLQQIDQSNQTEQKGLESLGAWIAIAIIIALIIGAFFVFGGTKMFSDKKKLITFLIVIFVIIIIAVIIYVVIKRRNEAKK